MDNLLETFLSFGTAEKVSLGLLAILWLVIVVLYTYKCWLEYKLCGGDYSKLADIKHEMAHRRIESGD